MSLERDTGQFSDAKRVTPIIKDAKRETSEDELVMHRLCERLFKLIHQIKDSAIRVEIENIVTEINRDLLDMEAEGVVYVRNPQNNHKPEVQTLCAALLIKIRHILMREESMPYRAALKGVFDHTSQKILPFLHDTYYIENFELESVVAAPTIGPHELLLAEFEWMDKIEDPVIRISYLSPVVGGINELLKEVENQVKKKKRGKDIDLKEKELQAALGRLKSVVERIMSDSVVPNTNDRHYVELIQKNMEVLIPRYIAGQKERLSFPR